MRDTFPVLAGQLSHGPQRSEVTLPASESAQSWDVTGSDGRHLRWQGFFTGPRLVSGSELDAISRTLVGVGLGGIAEVAGRELEPYPLTPGVEPVVVLGSASTLKKSFESDLACVEDGRPPDDFATYNEARSVYLASPGDLVVGRTRPWREAAALAGLEAVDVPGVDYYYLTHALLKLATAHAADPSPAIDQIVGRLRRQPHAVVRVFALDEESMVLLVWLKRTAGLARLRVDANGPVVAHYWNQKSTLHPTTEAAGDISVDPDGGDPFDVLAAESATTHLCQELGVVVPRLPGYTVRAGGPPGSVLAQMRGAAQLLRDRYGLELGCLKPATALTGARIRTAVPLHSPAAVDALAAQVSEGDEDYVLEAHADYLRHAVTGYEFILAPSVHIRAAAVGEGATLQITRGSVWQGNVYLDERSCEQFGISREQYAFVRTSLGDFLSAFQASDKDLGLVKGGIDFAITRLGGRFGDRPVVGMQDLNLSANGAEFLRGFLAEARQVLAAPDGTSPAPVYAATKVIRPSAGASLDRLRSAFDHVAGGRYLRAITSVPGRWGLIGAAGPSSVGAAESVLEGEARLFGAGLVEASLRPALMASAG